MPQHKDALGTLKTTNATTEGWVLPSLGNILVNICKAVGSLEKEECKCIYAFYILAILVQWNPDVPLAVRDGADGKETRDYLPLSQGKRD